MSLRREVQPGQAAQPASPDNGVLIEHAEGVLRITLNRPHRANALDPQSVETIIEALSNADDARACVIRGNGKNFCAGFDLADLETSSDGDLLMRFVRIETLLQMVHHAPFPILALGQGSVVGAGADLFAACWARIAAPDARFAMPGWNFELALGTRRLAALVGADAARDLLIDSKTIDAPRALEVGLTSSIEDVAGWPEQIARFQQRATVLSPRAIRELSALTVKDSRREDMAALVATASRPGLKARVASHVERVSNARRQRKPQAQSGSE